MFGVTFRTFLVLLFSWLCGLCGVWLIFNPSQVEDSPIMDELATSWSSPTTTTASAIPKLCTLLAPSPLLHFPADFLTRPGEVVTRNFSAHSEFVLSKHAKLLAEGSHYNCTGRLIVYLCDEYCGGLGDRVKGVITAFVMALVSNSEFIVQWNKPLPLESFYILPLTWASFEGSKSQRISYYESLSKNHSRSIDVLNSWGRADVKSVLKDNGVRFLTISTNLAGDD